MRSSRILARVLPAALAIAGAPRVALAHSGHIVGPGQLWSAWHPEATTVLAIVLGSAIYALGVRRLWTRAGVGHGLPWWRVIAFGGAIVAAVVALASPLDELSGTLFAAHMGQHLVLVLVVAPLLALGSPGLAGLWALPDGARTAVGGWIARSRVRSAWSVAASAWFASLAHGVALWVWHAPGPYQLALRSPAAHAAEHASFLVTGALVWWVVFRDGSPRRQRMGSALGALFFTMMQSGLLGALLTFSRVAWYPIHGIGARAWHTTVLDDQHLAGLLMWVPATLVYTLVAAVVLGRWLAAAPLGSTFAARPAQRDPVA